jgi:hypothetical protein
MKINDINILPLIEKAHAIEDSQERNLYAMAIITNEIVRKLNEVIKVVNELAKK